MANVPARHTDPLTGDLRKAQAKGVRYADGLHDTYFGKAKMIRSAAEEKIREADRLECEAWNALMWAWATGEMHPVIDDQQANPTIARPSMAVMICLRRSANAVDVFRWCHCVP
ncbi:hypothetical protein BjapCC829_39750 [Bradyrhizobium barranii]|uniref:Uncharacterized protein n=1 Tax=Bradyrhizobium barranii TaxID=2992140 RepID=A0ABY3QL93_9BRAD|nr:hypothetical protein [Bradyrhizobium japonicum]UFW85962.1 hypothetical protein BjapCC829_39750 [Bradyrhizobium japonicum]